MFKQVLGLAAGVFLMAGAAQARPPAPTIQTVPQSYLSLVGIPLTDGIIDVKRISDNTGDHVLVLNRVTALTEVKRKVVDEVQLTARYYSQSAYGWHQMWMVRDGVKCSSENFVADFFPSAINKAGLSATDLDGNGQAEITVAYHLFCGDDVAPQTVKLIMREGDTKLAVRGEALLRFVKPAIAAQGGKYVMDSALNQPEYAAHRRHLKAMWDSLAVDVPY